jgi:hypothetical protein
MCPCAHARAHLLLQLHPPDAARLDLQVQGGLEQAVVHGHHLVAQQPELVKVGQGQVLLALLVRKLEVLAQLSCARVCE